MRVRHRRRVSDRSSWWSPEWVALHGTDRHHNDAGQRAAGRIIGRMPEIARFRGIVIRIYHSDHGPPHFHAVSAGHEVSVEVESGVIRGTFPSKALAHLIEWAELHRADLLANWARARLREPLERIAPLE